MASSNNDSATQPQSNDVKHAVSNMSELLTALQKQDIQVKVVEHEPVFTVEAMMNTPVKDMSGVTVKNLFLRDKKRGLWLLVARHDAPVRLNEVAKQAGAPSGGLRLADEDTLWASLGVRQGCVTPLALINDTVEHKVHLLLDQEVVLAQQMNCHPMSNAATCAITLPDFFKFLNNTGHTYRAVTLTEAH